LDGCVRATDATAPPVAYGPSATSAWAISDADGAQQCQIRATAPKSGGDASDFVLSVFVKKLAGAPSVFPNLYVQSVNGASTIRGFSFDAFTGTTDAGATDTLPAATGVVDADTNWWRVWWRHSDSAATEMRLGIFPSRRATLTGGDDSTLTGSIVVWGANVTQGSTLLPYEPSPPHIGYLLVAG